MRKEHSIGGGIILIDKVRIGWHYKENEDFKTGQNLALHGPCTWSLISCLSRLVSKSKQRFSWWVYCVPDLMSKCILKDWSILDSLALWVGGRSQTLAKLDIHIITISHHSTQQGTDKQRENIYTQVILAPRVLLIRSISSQYKDLDHKLNFVRFMCLRSCLLFFTHM